MSAINNISLYIPHIFANYSKENVANVFETLKIGKVKNIDFISKMGNDNKPFNAAYIHFYYWYDNIGAANFQEKVLHKSPTKLMYDEPWFWLVLENKGKKIVSGERKKCLNIGDLNKSFISPKKTSAFETTPRTPKKGNYDERFDIDNVAFNMNNAFEGLEYTQMMDEMADCENSMEQEDHCLISIDGRYVEEMEQSNTELRLQLAQMQNAYYSECMKSQSLAQALQMVNNK